MNAGRHLIVNADDFGRSPGINEGVMQAYEQGIVTSASLMVRWPDAKSAAAYAGLEGLALGLHVDLGEWVVREGQWKTLYRVVDPTDTHAVRDEVNHQLDLFRSLCGRNPSHLDSHQHVHLADRIVGDTLEERADELGIYLRGRSNIEYCGAFYGQGRDGAPAHNEIRKERLIDILQALPAGPTELACHPATRHDTDSMYGLERVLELHALCDPEVEQTIADAHLYLVSFSGLPR